MSEVVTCSPAQVVWIHMLRLRKQKRTKIQSIISDSSTALVSFLDTMYVFNNDLIPLLISLS